MSHTQIAKKIGRTPNAVKLRASRLGIRLSAGRRTAKEAAEILGVNHQTVTRLRDKLNLRFRRYKNKSRGALKTIMGVSDEHLLALAKHLLMSRGNVKTTAKRLRAVISEYSTESTL